MRIRAHTFCILTLAISPIIAEAQVGLGARMGWAGGSSGYTVLEGHGRVRAFRNVYLTSSFELIGGLWACADSPLNAIRCGYDGHSILVGGAFTLRDTPRTLLALTGGTGVFVRTGTYAGREYTGDRHLIARIGIQGDVRLWGPIRFQAFLGHRQIFDGRYREAFGKNPHYTGLSVGMIVVAGSTRDE